MNKENIKEIITPITKKKIILKEWITGGEYNEIQKPITDIQMFVDAKGITKGEINAGESSRKSVEKAIEIVVLEVDGNKEKTLKAIEDLPKPDYDFVIQELNKVVKGDAFTSPSLKQSDGIN